MYIWYDQAHPELSFVMRHWWDALFIMFDIWFVFR